MTGANSKHTRPMDWDAFIKSEPFQCGVADYLAGTWTSWDGYDWRNLTCTSVYESGRLSAAAVGGPCRDFMTYLKACDARAFPPPVPEEKRRLKPLRSA